MPRSLTRYRITTTAESVGHLEQDADDAAVQDGALVLYRDCQPVLIIRPGAWSIAVASDPRPSERTR